MDTFEIQNGYQPGLNRPVKWKTKIILGLAVSIALVGFPAVLLNIFFHRYNVETTVDILDAAAPASLTDSECEQFCTTKGCIITGIVENPINDSDSDSLKKTKILFSSCTNVGRRNNASLDDFRQFLADVYLAWPVLQEDWECGGTDWKSSARQLENDYEIHAIFDKNNEISNSNPFGNVFLECKIPTLPMEAYLHNETSKPYILKIYSELMESVLHSLGVEWAKRKDFVEEIIELETELAQAILDSTLEGDVRQPPSRNVVRVLEDSEDVLNELMPSIRSKCQGNINKLFDVLTSRPEKVVKNYLGWRTIYSVLRFLNSDLKEFSDAYIGSFPNSPPVYTSRFRECVAGVRDEMGLLAYKVFLDAGYLAPQKEQQVRSLMTETKTSFAALLQTLPWMDNHTLSAFHDKLKQMKLNIGCSKDIRNDHGFDHLYHSLEINENDTYFINVMKIRKLTKQLMYNEHRKYRFDALPLGIESSYEYVNNVVDVNVGLLQSPVMIYGEDYPKYLKYAHAVPLAHEMSHAFDSFGALFNASGAMEGIEWWPAAVKQKFFNFVGCLRQQESVMTGVGANKVHHTIINDDIADLGSLFITYAGLSLHLRVHGDNELPLPGLSLNKKQTYFVQAAQMFCDVREPRLTVVPYMQSPRSGKQKLNSAIENVEDFGAVFNCPVGSPMNPEHKCNLLR